MSGARTRIVLLGASNVQMGRRGLVTAALRAAGEGGADVLLAAGHGRSYGAWSRAGVRGLPGIVDSGLWPALARLGADGPGYAVLTDVGNDLAYGASPGRLAGWIATCLERLRERGFEVALSRFPAASVAAMGGARFLLLRTLLFPRRRFSLRSILDAGQDLNRRLDRLAAGSGATCVDLAPDWFGPDRIHLLPGCRRLAWQSLLGPFGAAAPADGGSPRPVTLRGARAEVRTVLGWERRTEQPCLRLEGGTAVSFF